MNTKKCALLTLVAAFALILFAGVSSEAFAAGAFSSVRTQKSAPSFHRTHRFAARATFKPTHLKKVTVCRETMTDFQCRTEFTK